MLTLAQKLMKTFDYVHFCDCGPHKDVAPCNGARVKITGIHDTPGFHRSDAAATFVTLTVDANKNVNVKHEYIMDGVVVHATNEEFLFSHLARAVVYAHATTAGGGLTPLRYYEKGETFDIANFARYSEYNTTFAEMRADMRWDEIINTPSAPALE